MDDVPNFLVRMAGACFFGDVAAAHFSEQFWRYALTVCAGIIVEVATLYFVGRRVQGGRFSVSGRPRRKPVKRRKTTIR